MTDLHVDGRDAPAGSGQEWPRWGELLASAGVLAGLLLIWLPLFPVGPLSPAASLALAVVGLAIAAAGAWLDPRAGLAGVMLALPFVGFPREIAGQSLSPVEVALLVTTGAVVARRVVGRPVAVGGPPTVRPDWASLDRPIALLLASALASLLVTEYLRLSLRELRLLIVEPVAFWYLCRLLVRGPGDVARLVGALTVATTAVAVVGLVQIAAGGAVTDVQGVRRVLGTYTSPNHFALVLGRSLPFLLAFAWLRWPFRVPATLGLLLCGGALVATFSIGGWIGTAAGLLVVMWQRVGRRVVVWAAIAALVAGIAILAVAPVERLAGRLDPRQGTSLVRLQLWQASLVLVRASPVLGIGLDNFLYRYVEAMPPGTPVEPNLSHPHNLVLQAWLQLGIGGAIALGWLLTDAARRLTRSARSTGGSGASIASALSAGALGSLADFVVHGLVDNSYFLPDLAVIFWLTVAVAVSVSTSGGPVEERGHGAEARRT